jgi:hypothetical protein
VRPGNLYSHILCLIGLFSLHVRPYNCNAPGCGMSFADPAVLTRHRKRLHNHIPITRQGRMKITYRSRDRSGSPPEASSSTTDSRAASSVVHSFGSPTRREWASSDYTPTAAVQLPPCEALAAGIPTALDSLQSPVYFLPGNVENYWVPPASNTPTR